MKPEPHHEIPQAASAHDTFWDFVSLMPESFHMIMWVMSDRAIPRSFRMMEGFGIHTFRFINAKGESRFVKFHWKPLLGMHSVLWDEAQKISGNDPDFHRRDLWEAIESGAFPEWEFGVQVVEEKDEHKFDFDLLDPTKIIPEELVPVQRIGRMTLNRNPDNFFAETEQVAFHPGHIVPGIDFTNDPLLQGRLFSYTDTQLTRLGGPNFAEIPINRPTCPMHNNQRDGHMRMQINRGQASYNPNTTGGGCPFQVGRADGGFVSFPQPMRGVKERARSEKFFDHFSQAALFFRSQSPPEQEHIVQALTFELGNCDRADIGERIVGMLVNVDRGLAERVAAGLGIKVPAKVERPLNHSIPADGKVQDFESKPAKKNVGTSPALSMANTIKNTIKSRKIAFLAADGANGADILAMQKALTSEGAVVKIVAPRGGTLQTAKDGGGIKIDFSLLNAASVMFDAVYIPGGEKSATTLAGSDKAIHFVNEMYKHCKAIAASGAGAKLLRASAIKLETNKSNDPALIVDENGDAKKVAAKFIKAIAQHRNWDREKIAQIPA